MRPMPELKVVNIQTDELVEYRNNAKLHPMEQVDQIAASIEEFGFNSPILAWHNDDWEPEIVAGHGRLMAARKLGLKELPVVFLDHMSEEQRRAYILVDNQLTMNSGFDDEILGVELSNIIDIDMSQFDFDIKLGDVSGEGVGEIEEDEVPEDAPSIVKRGDVWQLGRHRLMCGDSTDQESVDKLMDGNRADVCFTSPPYNMNAGNICDLTAMNATYLNNNGGKAYGEYDDDESDEGYTRLLTESMSNALRVCDDALFNIGVLAHSKSGIVNMLAEFSDRLCDIIVWDKGHALPMGLPSQKAALSHPCELVFCFNQTGYRTFSHPQWEKGTGENVIRVGGASGNEYASEHNATFPVEFAVQVVRNFTDNSVLDLFGGTGTTLVAAEQLNRTCYMMELDPHYCDIIIERWQNLTGETAEMVEHCGQ